MRIFNKKFFFVFLNLCEIFLETYKVIRKNKIIGKILPLPLLNKLPKYIEKNTRLRGSIFLFNPIIKPIVENTIVIKILPMPKPKYVPAYVINKREYNTDILVA